MEKEKRNQKLFKYIETGKTFTKAAQKFKISSSRVEQVYNRVKNKQNWPKFRKMIPPQAQTVILFIFNQDEDVFNHPEKIAKIPFKTLTKFKNMGFKRARKVQSVCKKLGYPVT